MKLITKSANNKLKKQYALGSDFSKQNAIVKLFNPYGKGTWYVVNTDPEDEDYLYGIAVLDEIEIGSFSRKELENLRVKPFNLPLERDTSFDEINAEKLYQMLLENRHKDYEVSELSFEELNTEKPPKQAKMEIVKDTPSQADIIMDLLVEQTRQRPYSWTIEEENYNAIYKGIELCLSYDIPLFWIEKFVLGTMITTEGEKQGFPSPELVVVMPQYITEYFENFLESYGKNIFEAGWKYLEIDADILKNLGFSFYQTLKTEYGDYDTWLSNDLKSVFAYKNNGGGYMSFLSIDFAEGYNAANRITNACSYVKDVDYFFNGLGGISRDESLQIIIDALKNQAAQLTEYLKPSKMEHGGDIKKTYFMKDAQHNAASFNNISKHLQVPSAVKRHSSSHVGLSEKHRHPEAMLQKKNRGGNVDLQDLDIANADLFERGGANYSKSALLEFTKKTNDLRVKRNRLIKGTPSHTALQKEIDKRENLVIRDKDGNTIGLKTLKQGGDLQDLDIANADLFAKGGQIERIEGWQIPKEEFYALREKEDSLLRHAKTMKYQYGDLATAKEKAPKADVDKWLEFSDFLKKYDLTLNQEAQIKSAIYKGKVIEYDVLKDYPEIAQLIVSLKNTKHLQEAIDRNQITEANSKKLISNAEKVLTNNKLEKGGDLQDLDIANSDLFSKGGYNKIHRADSKSSRELYIHEIAIQTNISRNSVRDFAEEYSLSDDALLKISMGMGRDLISNKDVATAIIGNKNNPYAKEIVKFSKSDASYRVDKKQFSAAKNTNEKSLNFKDAQYIPPYDIAKIEFKDGSEMNPESVYDDWQNPKNHEGFTILSGVYYNERPLRKDDQNQLELFEKGGKMPESSKYYKFSEIAKITTKMGDVIEGNQIYNGLWISNDFQKALMQKAFKEKASNRNEKKNPVSSDNFEDGGNVKSGYYSVVNKVQRDKEKYYLVVDKNVSFREGNNKKAKYRKTHDKGWLTIKTDLLNKENSHNVSKKPFTEKEKNDLETHYMTIASELMKNNKTLNLTEARNMASQIKKELKVKEAILKA